MSETALETLTQSSGGRAVAKKRMRKGRPKALANKKAMVSVDGKRGRSGAGRRYSDAERQRILDAAKREQLTGKQVAQRFGVSALTYYTWRKKSGSAGQRRGRPPGTTRQDKGGDLSSVLRDQVQAEIRRRLPDIIAEEIDRYFR